MFPIEGATDSITVPCILRWVKLDTVSAVRRARGTLWKWMGCAGLRTESQDVANCKTVLRFQSDSSNFTCWYMGPLSMESLSPVAVK